LKRHFQRALSNKKEKTMNNQNAKRLSQLPIETLPPDPEGMNDNRARWADNVLEMFQRLTGTDFEDVLSDMLVDLMHWCDR
jgi:hypothetical protein